LRPRQGRPSTRTHGREGYQHLRLSSIARGFEVLGIRYLGIRWRIVALNILAKKRAPKDALLLQCQYWKKAKQISNSYYSTTFIFTASKFLLYTLLVFILK